MTDIEAQRAREAARRREQERQQAALAAQRAGERVNVTCPGRPPLPARSLWQHRTPFAASCAL
jgi:hypothetical protein